MTTTQPPLNPNALENAADVIWMNTRNESGVCDADRQTDDYATIEAITSVAIKEYLAVDQPELRATSKPKQNFEVVTSLNSNPETEAEMQNTDPRYWHKHYPYTCAALEEVTGDELSANANQLAYIAGDYARMDDDEVLATIINENLPR